MEWSWSSEAGKAFNNIKPCLCVGPVLAHYDPMAPLVVACDACPYGIGSVLSHRYADGTEPPIAHVSRTLTNTETNYAQVDREALVLVSDVIRVSVRSEIYHSH